MLTNRSSLRRARGFSLVEVMISLVLGLIVVGAALALTVSIIQSNGLTVRSTRLTQELRAVTEVIGRELRRARAVDDAIARVGRPDLTGSPYNAIDIATAGCVLYGYSGPTNPRRAIRRTVVGTVGTIQLAQGTNDAPPDCGTPGDALSSPQVDITAFTIAVAAGDLYNITVTGGFAGDNTISRTITTAVRVRSAALP
jgi:prepilin-type N-terminal cleavage/methylation domain-containing protein